MTGVAAGTGGAALRKQATVREEEEEEEEVEGEDEEQEQEQELKQRKEELGGDDRQESDDGDEDTQVRALPMERKRTGGIRFADETAADEAVPEPVTARVTRSKRAKLDELRSEHEQIVANMKAHEARKAAAALQLLSHYKSEAERLLTLTQKSRAVATSRRIVRRQSRITNSSFVP